MNDPGLDDETLLALLSAAIDDDAVPAAAVATAIAAKDVFNLEGQMASLIEEADDELVSVRASSDAVISMLKFVSPRMTIELELGSDGEIVGVITPPDSLPVQLEVASERRPTAEVRAMTDELGRFRVSAPTGLCRLKVGAGDDSVTTSWFYC
jgi:hypothetical protein